MKTKILILLMSITLISCVEETTGPIELGTIVFSTPTNAKGTISVKLKKGNVESNGPRVQITNNPVCGGGDGYSVLDVGTYSYTATSSTGSKWEGTFTLTKDNCTFVKLQ